MVIRVVRGGMLTTVQDLGRPGLRAAGVPLGGAMDSLALRLANLAAGNPEDAAGLEMTLAGPELEFSADAVVAITGATAEAVETGRPLRVRAGERLDFGRLSGGCRAYLAVAGGIDVPVALGGRGTYLRAGWGGWQGRALRDGDAIPTGKPDRTPVAGDWRIDPRMLPAYSPHPLLRVVRGAHMEEFNAEWRRREFEVSPQSDRMGVRLRSAPLARREQGDLLSRAVAPGTVQVPPDGQPIILGADAQTIGGYPQLAHVIGVDLPLLAQLRPGDRMRFAEVTLDEAHQRLRAREQALAVLRNGLAHKFR